MYAIERVLYSNLVAYLIMPPTPNYRTACLPRGMLQRNSVTLLISIEVLSY